MPLYDSSEIHPQGIYKTVGSFILEKQFHDTRGDQCDGCTEQRQMEDDNSRSVYKAGTQNDSVCSIRVNANNRLYKNANEEICLT